MPRMMEIAATMVLALTACWSASAVVGWAKPLSAQDLAKLDRVSDPHLSPDGSWILYQVSSADLAANKRASAVFLAPSDGSDRSVRMAEAQVLGGILMDATSSTWRWRASFSR